LTRWTISS